MTRNLGPTLPLSEEIHKTKYRGTGESFREAMNRVSWALRDDDEHFHNLRNILLEQRFLPAGRVQAAMGSTRYVTAYNCFVSGTIKDSFVDSDGIMDRAKEAATTMRMGGGIGYDFSTLRPRGELIKTLQSRSSGPISFMGIFNEICLCTSSAGHRRGAQMGILRVDHPDIEEFIHAKQNEERLKGFNISIGVTDEFMRAVRDNTDFDLRWGGRVYKTINARTLWEAVMRSTFDWAEPGVIFIDAVNRKNNLWYCEDIAATNPCFAPGTLITTREGPRPIESLVGQEVDVWDGKSWVTVDNFRVTGRNQEMIRIELQDGSDLKVTPYHTMVLEGGAKVEAKDLKVGSKLQLSSVEAHGKESTKAPYLKGFLLGDGSEPRKGRIWLGIYEGKEGCKDRLVESAKEIGEKEINTNAVTELGWNYENTGVVERETLAGLAPRKHELLEWVRCRDSGLPEEVFTWNEETKRNFIAGYMDADGTVTDQKNGYGYQVSSINKKLLKDFQTLLKTFGVLSKLSLSRSGGWRDMPGGTYKTKDTWRLVISQVSARRLSSKVSFSRLKDFSDRRGTYTVIPRMGEVVKIENDGVEEAVYCCTVPTSNKLQTANGVMTGNCGEQPLPPYGACLLGSFNLVKYLKPINGHAVDPRFEGNGYYFDVEQLRGDVPRVVRAMDNVIDQAFYPLSEQRDEALDKRRMGLGVTGVANALETLGYLYGDKDMVALFETIMATITQFAYEASAGLAAEKGAFPKFDKEKYLQGEFIKSLPKRTQEMIAKYGIRNSHLMSIAPTGTISLSADNVSSGIEPVFSTHFHRNVGTFDGFRTERVDDYAYRMFGTRGRLTEECSVDHHIRMLVAANKYVDSSVSKTCNVSPMMPWEEFKRVYFDAWRGDCKGCTTFNPGGRRMGILNNAEESDGDEEQEVVSGASCVRDPETGKIDCE